MEDAKFQVLKTEYWDAFVAPDQLYLGRLVVVLRDPNFSDNCPWLRWVPMKAHVEFHYVVDHLERALIRDFRATMFNWSCLMNNAYQEDNPKPHVHWHFRPRYKEPVEIFGQVFTDPNFGHHYLREDTDKKIVSDVLREAIAYKIREAIEKCRI